MQSTLIRSLALVFALSAAPASAQIEIHTINIGRGDCALILSPTGTRVLLDTGKPGDGNAVVIPYLQSVGVTDLDYILISHYDGDHIGGVPELMAAGYTPLAVYDRGDLDAEMHSIWQDYVNAIGGLRTQITSGMVLDLGGGLTMTNYIVNGEIFGGPTIGVIGKVENAKSAGWKLEYNNFDYGTFGDIGDTFEGALGPVVGDLDVYKASHHGSPTSSSIPWVAAVTPDVTFVSSGSDSSNPKQQTFNQITTSSAMRWIYMTNDSYTLTQGGRPAYDHMVLKTTGSGYTIEGATIRKMEFLYDEITSPVTAQPGDIALSEFLVDPASVVDTEGEYIEITNLTTKRFSMRGWTLHDNAGDSITISTNAILGPRESLLIAAQGDIGRNGGIVPHAVWPLNGFALNNSGWDRIILENELGTRLVDHFHPGTQTAGKSWERKNLYEPLDTGNMALGTQVFGLGDRGTPGDRNSSDTTPWNPDLRTIAPNVGLVTGGKWVTLTGYDIASYSPPVIVFGAAGAATGVQILDQNTVLARSPALVGNGKNARLLAMVWSKLAEGPLTVPITLLTASGASVLDEAFTYELPFDLPLKAPKQP